MVPTFDHIYDTTKSMTKKEKGDYFENYVYELFTNDPRLKNGLTKIWLYNDVPKHHLEQLHLPKRDKGIDLLAIINGNYYAIQCKFRQNPNDIISWRELSTFFGLTFGMTHGIHRGILVTNTYNLCQEVINSECIDVIYGDFFNNIPEIISDTSDVLNCVIPREYQSDCVMKTSIYLLDNPRCMIEMACGSGKTLTSYWIRQSFGFRKTIIFVPSLYLLSQFYSDWIFQYYF